MPGPFEDAIIVIHVVLIRMIQSIFRFYGVGGNRRGVVVHIFVLASHDSFHVSMFCIHRLHQLSA